MASIMGHGRESGVVAPRPVARVMRADRFRLGGVRLRRVSADVKVAVQ
ncbi:hypothetical protein ACF3M1_09570 [Luteimonas sp. WGS1318]